MLFDAADPNVSVATRLPTTTPTQALFLMNSPFVHEQSEFFARQLMTEQNEKERVQLAFESAYGRVPRSAEIRDAIAFVEKYQEKLLSQGIPLDQQPLKAWAALARVLLTSNAFL